MRCFDSGLAKRVFYKADRVLGWVHERNNTVKKIGLVLTVVLMLGGCSSKLAYNNLDWLASWYLDDFVELTDQQEEEFEKRLSAILVWHREEELPQYKAQLLLLQQQLQSPEITAQQWSQHIQKISAHWLRIRDKASLEMAIMAPELSKEQVSDFFEALKEHNQEKREEFEELSAQEVKDKRIENIVEKLEEHMGWVSSAQLAVIEQYVASSNTTPLVYLAYSDRFQLGLKKTFIEVDKSQLSSHLYELLSYPEQFKLAKTLQGASDEKRLVANMLQQVHAKANEEQLDHFKGEVRELIELIDQLLISSDEND